MPNGGNLAPHLRITDDGFSLSADPVLSTERAALDRRFFWPVDGD